MTSSKKNKVILKKITFKKKLRSLQTSDAVDTQKLFEKHFRSKHIFAQLTEHNHSSIMNFILTG